ncbi:MAG: hypothetical protein WKF52_06770 [Sphingomicrobium sp.]
MRQPDMLVTAENGWLGDLTGGEDKKAALRRELTKYERENELEVTFPECLGEGYEDEMAAIEGAVASVDKAKDKE